MAQVAVGGTTWDTTSGSKTAAVTRQVGGLIAVFVSHQVNTNDHAVTDDDGGTYIKVGQIADAVGTGLVSLWVRTTLIASGPGTSIVITSAPGATSGGGLTAAVVTGMTRVGLEAIRSTGTQATQAAGTPAPVLSKTPLSPNPLWMVVQTQSNSTANAVPRAGWTENFDTGYNTPASGWENSFINSGETSATLTMGGATPSGFSAFAVEFDASDPGGVQPHPIMVGLPLRGVRFRQPVITKYETPSAAGPTIVTSGPITSYGKGGSDTAATRIVPAAANARGKGRATNAPFVIVLATAYTPPVTRLKQNTAEGGTNGTTVTNANSGGASGDAFDDLGLASNTERVFDSGWSAHGTYSIRSTAAAGASNVFYGWLISPTLFEEYVCVYGQWNVNAANANAPAVQFRNAANAASGVVVRFSNAGKIALLDASNTIRYTSTKTFAAQEPFRLEVHAVHDATNGHIEARLFYGSNIDGLIPDETLGNLTDNWNTDGTGLGSLRFGSALANAPSVWTDDEGIGTTGWLGPSVATGAPLDAIGKGRSTAVATTFTPSLSVDPVTMQPLAVGIGASGRRVGGPPILRAQELPPPSVVTFVNADAIAGRGKGRSTTVGTDIVQTAAQARGKGRAAVVGIDVEQGRSNARGKGRAAVSGLDIVQGRANAQGHGRSTTVIIQQSFVPVPAPVLIPQIGPRRPLGGPPILRVQQQPDPILVNVVTSTTVAWGHGRATITGTNLEQGRSNSRGKGRSTVAATDVVQAATTGRGKGRASANGIVLVQGAARGQGHGRATTTIIQQSFVDMPAAPPLPLARRAGFGRIGPPILRVQEAGPTVFISTINGVANGQGHGRATAVAQVIEQSAAIGRGKGRTSVVGTDIVRAASNARGKGRATAQAIGIIQGRANARGKGRATTVTTAFVRGLANARGKGRATTATILTAFASAQARGKGYARTAASTFTMIVDAVVQQPVLRRAGFGRFGPPILRTQEMPGPYVPQLVTSGPITAQGHGRAVSTATRIVTASCRGQGHGRTQAQATDVVLGTGRGRGRGRAQTAATRIVSGAAAGRGRGRSVPQTRVLVQGSTIARAHGRAAATGRLFVTGTARGYGHGRSAARGIALLQARAHGRGKGWSSAQYLSLEAFPASTVDLRAIKDAGATGRAVAGAPTTLVAERGTDLAQSAGTTSTNQPGVADNGIRVMPEST